MMDTRDGTLLWGQQYSGHSSDVQLIQGGIAAAIAQKLRGQEQESLTGAAGQRTTSPEAYDSYLKGNYYAAKFAKETMLTAMVFGCFETNNKTYVLKNDCTVYADGPQDLMADYRRHHRCVAFPKPVSAVLCSLTIMDSIRVETC